ncbi:MAG: DUF3419 family protein [Alphaproteobacteria bacterium]|nr:DUF3419 family protein [Alphaproteobacteria bacterium]
MTKKPDFSIPENYAYQDGAPVYLFTNENIHGTLKTAGDLSGKKILTVGASGDQVFESYLMGAGDVHTFDINSNQKNVIELKNHMIRGLSYENFMDFFFSAGNFFNQNILAPISPFFSDNLRNFLKQCSRKDACKNFKYRAAYTREYDINKLQYISNENNFNAVRDKLPEQIPFKHCDISTAYKAMQYCVQHYGSNYLNQKTDFTNIPPLYANFTEKYDLILLSNIFNYLYLDSIYTEEKFLKMHRNVLAPLVANNTTENGRVYFHYIWGEKTLPWVNFLQYFQTQHASPFELVARTVDGAFHGHRYDTVLYATHRQR